ncbi:hypothetical protein EMIT0P395_30186 [Pseudomonas sp. IT-P395]
MQILYDIYLNVILKTQALGMQRAEHHSASLSFLVLPQTICSTLVHLSVTGYTRSSMGMGSFLKSLNLSIF